MSKTIKVKNKKIIPNLCTAFQIALFHQGTQNIAFGGEIEVMLLEKKRSGRYSPISYEKRYSLGAKSVFNNFVSKGDYTVLKTVDGKPTILENADNSILCFEKYASIIERTDKSYSANKKGIQNFLKAINDYALQIENIAKQSDLLVSPFDYDPFCEEEDFCGTEAPSERFGDNGFLNTYDNLHPKIDVVDRKTTSCHVSVGYEDATHLKRMMRILTFLTPSLYAAYSTVKPTYLVEKNGEKLLLSEKKAKGFKDKRPVLVPRALIWTLAAPDRSGLPERLIETVIDKDSTLENVINVYIDYPEISLSNPEHPISFSGFCLKGDMSLKDYKAHMSTLWFDWRADPIRLEARMAGTGVWKIKSLALLMLGGLVNQKGLEKLEGLIEKYGLTAKDLKIAQKNVAFHGLKTKLGDQNDCCSFLKEAISLVKEEVDTDFHDEFVSLETVLEKRMSDSEILLLQNKNSFYDLTKIPFSKRKSLASLIDNRCKKSIHVKRDM